MRWRTGWVTLVVATSLLAACGGGAPISSDGAPPEVPPTPRIRPSRPDVLLITLDTTRADRLGCYGHPEARTPHLDRLARQGICFHQARTQVPLTLPAHVSLLTGLSPSEHGIHTNGSGALARDIPVLAEPFRQAGYRTGAFLAAEVLDERYGLDRGFDRYDQVKGSPGDARELGERRADQVCDAALEWMADPSQPSLTWVHLFDPHVLYTPPEPYEAVGADAYDGEIAFMDHQIGRLLAKVAASARPSLVVAVGDHGEALGEHREQQHGLFLYDTTMRIPLILSFPGRIPLDHQSPKLVQLLDIMPTLLSLVGLDVPSGIQGADLTGLWQGEPWPDRAIVGESHYSMVAYRWAPLTSLTTERWKLIRAPRPELYDHRSDPGELANRYQSEPQVVTRLEGLLEQQSADHPAGEADPVDLDEADRQRLASLGYITEGAAPPPEEERPDPKDRVEVYAGYDLAQRHLLARRFDQAVATLEELDQGYPGEAPVMAALGEAYLELGRYVQAEDALRRCLVSYPDNARRWCQLGDAQRGQGKLEEAMSSYRVGAERNPEFGQAHSRIGLLLAAAGDHRGSAARFETFLRLEPRSPNARVNLAKVLIPLGRSQEAVHLLQEALEIDPGYNQAHQMLWFALLQTRRREEALDALRAAVDEQPDDLPLRRQLEQLEQGQPLGE